ncbi:PREDICTED: protein SIEVE ELEMENT OCCLUSION A-like isoform X1 [Theobroma cacao]|uniref:Protein SIEVE ELEMENT OCCLUSION A-like isoform X1 n=2 Tax=Theobroma cacao TaxID=3641 RepID=A0AB32WDY5_THECC|nr:PREDICTED: protein SIEVE ELEMENT OCCLUSION A-like isoform X1 [Theobroma cacao]
MAATTSNCQSITISQELSQKILITHVFDQTREVDLGPLVKVVESILQNAAAACKGEYEGLNDMICSLENFDGMRQALDDIRSISCEISCNLSDVEATTMVLLKRLRNYSWNAKVVLAVAAFALSIGELLMLLNHRTTDPIAMSVDLLKGHVLKLDINVLKQLLKAMVDVVNINFAFLVPTLSKIPKEAPSMKDAMDYFPTATYKILSVVVQIASIISKREYIIESTIRRLAHEVSYVNYVLQEKLERCRKDAANLTTDYEAKQGEKYYQHEQVEYRQYEGVWEVIIPKIGFWELIDKIKYHMKIQVPEKLRKKHVLLLISDLDISIEEIKVLNRLYQMNNQRYEILWFPIVDVATYEKIKFSELKQLMKWGAVDPSNIGPAFIEYIKKECNFLKNPIAVSLNQEGDVTCLNALPMLWTWGNSAFPFTDEKEHQLWNKIGEKTGWKLELLLDEQIDLDIPPRMRSVTFVCLFGGENISWIQKFTEKVKNATVGVSFKLVYVGKSKGKGLPSHLLSSDIHVIDSEFQWQFSTRLESILYAKIQQDKTSQTDRVMHEALKLLGYASNGEPWAMFSVGSAVMVTANGEMALTIMSNYKDWKKDTTGPLFLEALRNYCTYKIPDIHGCINVHLPVVGEIPGIVSCPTCSKEMEMYYTYRCCSE